MGKWLPLAARNTAVSPLALARAASRMAPGAARSWPTDPAAPAALASVSAVSPSWLAGSVRAPCRSSSFTDDSWLCAADAARAVSPLLREISVDAPASRRACREGPSQLLMTSSDPKTTEHQSCKGGRQPRAPLTSSTSAALFSAARIRGVSPPTYKQKRRE